MRRASLLTVLVTIVLGSPGSAWAQASPSRGLSLQVPSTPGQNLPLPPRPPAAPPASAYAPAPLPNRDLEYGNSLPSRAGTQVSPSLFTRKDEFRGDGFGKGSTAQSEQERRVRPGAGLSLRMPLTPN